MTLGFLSSIGAALSALGAAVLPPPPVEAGAPSADGSVVVVADEVTPLHLAVDHVNALVHAGGHSLNNTHLVVTGDEARKLGAYMPAASTLYEYQRHGGRLYVCAFDAARTAMDMQPLVEGAVRLPSKDIHPELNKKLSAYCYMPPGFDPEGGF